MNTSVVRSVELTEDHHLSAQALDEYRRPKGFPFLIDENQAIIEPVFNFV